MAARLSLWEEEENYASEAESKVAGRVRRVRNPHGSAGAGPLQQRAPAAHGYGRAAGGPPEPDGEVRQRDARRGGALGPAAEEPARQARPDERGQGEVQRPDGRPPRPPRRLQEAARR